MHGRLPERLVEITAAARSSAPTLQALALCAGIVTATASRYWPATEWLVVLLGAALFCSLAGLRPLVVFALALVGALGWSADGLARRATVVSGDIVVVEGRVDGLPAASAEFVRFELALHRQSGDRPKRLRKLRLSWYEAAAPRAGDYCRLRVRLREARGTANPADTDLAGWTLGRGIDAFATVRRDPSNACWSPGVDSIDRWRDQLRAAVAATGSSHAGVIAALALGDDSGLSPAQWELLRQTGTIHLVVISGLHVTALAGVAFVVLGWLLRFSPRVARRGLLRPLAAAGAGVVTFGYAALAGFGVATERALAMTLLVAAATVCGRVVQPFTTIALAAAAVLLVQPLAWREPGALLSFLGVAVLLYCLQGRLGERRFSIPLRGLVAWWHAQWIMLVAALPILLSFFGEAPLASPLGNLLAGALISVLAVPLSLVVTLLAGTDVAGLAPLMSLLAGVLDTVWRLLEWQRTHTGWAMLRSSAMPVLLAISGCLLLMPAGLPGRAVAALLLPLALVLQSPPPVAAGEFAVTSFDVGQGTAVLLRTANHALLYDTGPRYGEQFDAGTAILIPNLLAKGVVRLDRVVVSHADSDHAGGLAAVLQRLRVGDVVAPEFGSVDGVRSLCRAGQRWQWDGVRFAFLWPTEPLLPRDNDRSCVLLVTGNVSVLLPGDIERRAERGLLALVGRDNRVALGELRGIELMHSSHHGSRSSSGASFVAAVTPRHVIHSAASPSRFGHPHPRVVERFGAIGATQSITGELGALEWRSDRPGVTAWRCSPRYRWQLAPAGCVAVSRTTARSNAVREPAAGGPLR